MTAGILSERRAVAPFGLFGGSSGQKGLNILQRSSGRMVNLGGKATVQLQAGDIIKICTPGAGGFGTSPSMPGNSDRLSAAGKQQAACLPRFDVVGSVDNYRRLQETA